MAPTWRQWRYSGAMPSVQVKHVPDDVHRELRARAASAGQSLQEYLLERMVELARQPTLRDVLRDLDRSTTADVTVAEAVAAIRADRDQR